VASDCSRDDQCTTTDAHNPSAATTALDADSKAALLLVKLTAPPLSRSIGEGSVQMNPEDSIDWSAIPGSEWYRPENVAKSLTGLRNSDPTAPDVLYQIANNHAGELYPAAAVATPILLDIAIHSDNRKVAARALAVLDALVWFRGEPPFHTAVNEGSELPLDKLVRKKIGACRAQLVALAEREQESREIVLALLWSIDQQATE
jgi:hypothetical protein